MIKQKEIDKAIDDAFMQYFEETDPKGLLQWQHELDDEFQEYLHRLRLKVMDKIDLIFNVYRICRKQA